MGRTSSLELPNVIVARPVEALNGYQQTRKLEIEYVAADFLADRRWCDMSIKWVLAIGVGLAGGWAARSLADSPQGAGVKLLEIALKAKERVGRWAALEAERMEDMVAEARATAGPNVSRANGAASRANGAANKSRPKARSGNGQSGNGRRRTRPVKRAEQA